MKLYSVHLWDNNLKEERNTFVFANDESEAEDKALNDDYLECAEAQELNEVDGYKVILEKIE